MTWTNRFRLLAGVLGVVLLVAVLTLIFNQRQTQATSTTATVGAVNAHVGAVYGGTVIRQHVRVDSTVTEGDRMFTVQSISLRQDLANGLEVPDSTTYTVNERSGTITYLAPASGQVTRVWATVGSSPTSGESLARIVAADSQFVDAQFTLSPRDYERISEGAAAEILLPNNQRVPGTVSTIEVATTDAQAATKLRVESPELKDPELAALTRSGTPVTVTVQLRDDGPLAGVTDLAFDFLRQIGLG